MLASRAFRTEHGFPTAKVAVQIRGCRVILDRISQRVFISVTVTENGSHLLVLKSRSHTASFGSLHYNGVTFLGCNHLVRLRVGIRVWAEGKRSLGKHVVQWNLHVRVKPMKSCLLKIIALSLLGVWGPWAVADESEVQIPTLTELNREAEEHEGFFTFYWDARKGQLRLKVDRWEPFLYLQGLSSGLGSNPVGLDRGQLGKERVVHFRRVGPKVFLIQPNLRFRADSMNEEERRAVQESFASSVLASFDILAEDEDGSVLIDLTPFLMADAHDVVGTLRETNQGAYQLDGDRSYLYWPRIKGFPKNCEFEAALTFSTTEPGNHVRETAANPNAVTLRQHHSFIELPDPGYQTRKFDPRVGTFKMSYADYAADIGDPLWKHFVTRHRLEKQDPDQPQSVAKEPIVYYVDSGAPPEIKQALIEGASWWNAAFETAGYIDAFQVRELPEGVDPMDVRYNVIQWVHRSTRGWSYGASVVDPRTGEIIKGHVSLGSLRVHQDHLIIEGLQSKGRVNARAGQALGQCDCCALEGPSNEMAWTTMLESVDAKAVALARIRQLSAHEVGHTLGFSHNFAASTYDDRASVMDYPAPKVNIADDGSLDFSEAYGVGVGSWDHFVVNYAYREFSDKTREAEGLAGLIDQSIEDGLLYISDADARPPSAAHPAASLWDNGSDPVRQLMHEMRVRRIALEQVDVSQLPSGEPRSDFEIRLVPLYLHHRYQVEATAKMIGGASYNYGVVGDTMPGVEWVSANRQRQAVQALMQTLQTDALILRPALVSQLLPKSYAGLKDRERFSSQTSPLVDPVGLSYQAASWTLTHVLQPQRLARIESQAQRSWAVGDVYQLVSQATWEQEAEQDARRAAIQRAVQTAVLDHFFRLAQDTNASPSIRAQAEYHLAQLGQKIKRASQATEGTFAERSHRQQALNRIQRYVSRPEGTFKQGPNSELPPGSPIGQ